MSIRTPFGVYAAQGTAATPATGTLTVTEDGGNYNHITTIDIASLSLGATTNASLGMGKLLYTFPAGKILVTRASISLGIIGTAALNVASTPDLGLGAVVASGAVSVLSGTATFENIMTGQTVGACDNTATQNSIALTLSIAAADAHTVYLNIAAAWAGTDAGMLASGRVVLEWKYMS